MKNLVLLFMFLPAFLFAQATYTWVAPGGTGLILTSSNWSPARTAFHNDDTLVFDGNITPVAQAQLTTYASWSLGYSIVKNNCTSTLVSDRNATITLNGKMWVDSGSTSTLAGTYDINLTFSAGSAIIINGTFIFDGGTLTDNGVISSGNGLVKTKGTCTIVNNVQTSFIAPEMTFEVNTGTSSCSMPLGNASFWGNFTIASGAIFHNNNTLIIGGNLNIQDNGYLRGQNDGVAVTFNGQTLLNDGGLYAGTLTFGREGAQSVTGLDSFSIGGGNMIIDSGSTTTISGTQTLAFPGGRNLRIYDTGILNIAGNLTFSGGVIDAIGTITIQKSCTLVLGSGSTLRTYAHQIGGSGILRSIANCTVLSQTGNNITSGTVNTDIYSGTMNIDGGAAGRIKFGGQVKVFSGASLWIGGWVNVVLGYSSINEGTITSDVNSVIDFEGETFTNSGTVHVNAFAFARAGAQSITGMRKFTGRDVYIRGGATVNLAENDTLTVNGGGPVFVIQPNGRMNVNGIFVIKGGGTIHDSGFVFISAFSTLTLSQMNVRLYGVQIASNDATLKLVNCSVCRVDGGYFSSSSTTLRVSGGTTSMDRSAPNRTVIGGGLIIDSGATLYVLSFETLQVNSTLIINGTLRSDVHSTLDFRGPQLTNAGYMSVAHLRFNGESVQLVDQMDSLWFETAHFMANNSVQLTNTQNWTIPTSSTLYIYNGATLQVDGNVTFWGLEGCSSIGNQRCGRFIDSGYVTVNGTLWINCGGFELYNHTIQGPGTLKLGQEMSSYGDVMGVKSIPVLTSASTGFEVPAGCGIGIDRTMLQIGGEAIMSGTMTMVGNQQAAAVFNGPLIMNGGGFCGQWITVFECTGDYLVFARGGVTNLFSNPFRLVCDGTAAQSIRGDFSALIINNSAGITLSGNTTAYDTLRLINGNITTNEYVLTLGSAPNAKGALVRTAGWVIGNFRRWLDTETISNVLFPIGTEAQYRPVTLGYTLAPSAGGTLLAKHNEGEPGNTGLPLLDNGISITAALPSGYWSLTAGDGLAGGTYNLDIYANGFAGFADFTSLRLMKRANASANWSIPGIHVQATGSAASPVVHRQALTGFSEFGIGTPELVKTLQLTAFIEGMYSTGTGKQVSDTIKAYLVNRHTFTAADSSTAVLDSLGNAALYFRNAANDTSYYLMLKHRNAVETWSDSSTLSHTKFTGLRMEYSFAADSANAFGANLIKRGGVWCLYSGDVNQDGIVDFSDLSAVDNDSYNFVSGYVATDLTGDEFVDFSDLSICDNNSFNFVSVARPGGGFRSAGIERGKTHLRVESR